MITKEIKNQSQKGWQLYAVQMECKLSHDYRC